MTRHCLALFVACLAVVPSCTFGYYDPDVWIDREEPVALDVTDATGLACETHGGFITASASDRVGGQVRAVVYTRAGGRDRADAAECLEAVRVIARRDGDVLRLGWDWDPPRRRTWGALVSFRIQQPGDLPVDLATHNGELRAEGLTAHAGLSTHNGDIWVRGCAGSLQLDTHNGTIKAEGCAGPVDVESHNGPIEVELVGQKVAGEITSHNGGIDVRVADEACFRLVCETYNGSVRTQLASAARVSEGRRFLVADFGESPAHDLRIRTHNGSVAVRAADR